MTAAVENFNRVVLAYMPRMLEALDLTEEDCYAIFGNFGHESNGMFTLQEVKPTVKGSKGGYGWAQWTGPRRRSFESFCKKIGLEPSDDEANFRFFITEIKGPEAHALEKLKEASGLSNKVKAFEMAYERAGVKHYDSRLVWAKRAKDIWEAGLEENVVKPVEKEETSMLNGMLMGWILNKAKAIIAFFLTGLVTLIIQSIEQGGGINIPSSYEDWITSGIAAVFTALGVYMVPSKKI